MSLIRGVLLAGQFRTHHDLNRMSPDDQRNTLIVELSNRSNQKNFQALNDSELAGAGAVLVFLRTARIRDDAGLKTMSIDDMRNTLIVELGAMTGRGKELQGLSNLELVALGLGKFNTSIPLHENIFVRGVLLAGKFRTQHELNRMSEDDQRNTLIVELSGRSNQHNLQGFNSFDLAGIGAVLVFMRTARIRDDAQLKTMSFDDMRNTLIVEIDGQTHLGSRLQGLSNLDLVLAGLGVDQRAPIAARQIEEKYRQIGGKQSLLGRPVNASLSVQSNGQGFFRDFRGGQIKLTSDGAASAFVTHRTVVRFRGIHCFGKSEAVDEPYAIVGVYASDARDKIVVKKLPVDRTSYENFVASTDESASEEISLDVAPQTLVIVSTVMEHDSGDPDRVAAKVEDSLKKAALAAGADPADVSVFTGILDDLGIPGLIADLLGVGDDLIGIQALQLDIKEIIPKPPMNQFGNISFNFESPLLSDGDASYKLFYEVFVQEIPISKEL
jgi:hypothetical protein